MDSPLYCKEGKKPTPFSVSKWWLVLLFATLSLSYFIWKKNKRRSRMETFHSQCSWKTSKRKRRRERERIEYVRQVTGPDGSPGGANFVCVWFGSSVCQVYAWDGNNIYMALAFNLARKSCPRTRQTRHQSDKRYNIVAHIFFFS